MFKVDICKILQKTQQPSSRDQSEENKNLVNPYKRSQSAIPINKSRPKTAVPIN